MYAIIIISRQPDNTSSGVFSLFVAIGNLLIRWLAYDKASTLNSLRKRILLDNIHLTFSNNVQFMCTTTLLSCDVSLKVKYWTYSHLSRASWTDLIYTHHYYLIEAILSFCQFELRLLPIENTSKILYLWSIWYA